MIRRNNKSIFICQITDSHIRVVKSLAGRKHKREFTAFQAEAISSGIGEAEISVRLGKIFKKLGYSNNPVILSLPRHHATCRYLKIPAQSPQEIEKIANLQASRYLPYPANELIIGYQLIRTDKEGYSDINLIIAHKEAVQRYVRMFSQLKITALAIVLNSYGLCNFYSHIQPEAGEPVMLLDFEHDEAELAVVSHKKLLFSRSFKVNGNQSDWYGLFVNEIKKSLDIFLKEVSKELPGKLVVINTKTIPLDLIGAIKREINLPVEPLPPFDDKIISQENSFISLMGLGLEKIEETLNLLPNDIKERSKRASRRKEIMQLSLLALGALLISAAAMAKSLDNKARFLQMLKMKVSDIAKEAAPLEEIDRKLRIIESQGARRVSVLDTLYDLHKIINGQVSLTHFTYEEDGRIILRGEAQELSGVFVFVSQLESAAAFKQFNIKVRYATKRRTQAGESIDFEIICSRK
jgi:hypothetical protein